MLKVRSLAAAGRPLWRCGRATRAAQRGETTVRVGIGGGIRGLAHGPGCNHHHHQRTTAAPEPPQPATGEDAAGVEHLVELMEGFRRSKTLFAAVDLGVFDCLASNEDDEGDSDNKDRHGGPGLAASEIAQRLSLEPTAARMLLDACVGLNLLEWGIGEGTYALTPLARKHLVSSAPESFTGYVHHSDALLFPLWTHLQDAVREGTNRWQQALGMPQEEVFKNYYADDSARVQRFMAAMHSFGCRTSPAVASAFDLSGYGSMLDLGGGTGHLAMALKSTYPEASVVLADLPVVVASVLSMESGLQAVQSGVNFVTCDMFRDDLPTVALVALSRILHDWTDEQCVQILTAVHRALPDNGAVLIAEMLLDENPDCSPTRALLQSLNMLVQTHGRERTLAEFQDLLTRAGFGSAESRKTPTGYLDVLLASKQSP